MIQQTSLMAYVEALERINQNQFLVLKAIDYLGVCNNLQISQYLNFPINSVTPRVQELRKMKLVTLDHLGLCPITQRKTMFWRRIKK